MLYFRLRWNRTSTAGLVLCFEQLRCVDKLAENDIFWMQKMAVRNTHHIHWRGVCLEKSNFMHIISLADRNISWMQKMAVKKAHRIQRQIRCDFAYDSSFLHSDKSSLTVEACSYIILQMSVRLWRREESLLKFIERAFHIRMLCHQLLVGMTW